MCTRNRPPQLASAIIEKAKEQTVIGRKATRFERNEPSLNLYEPGNPRVHFLPLPFDKRMHSASLPPCGPL